MDKPPMEKPPTKEEILLEWFLGDSRDLLTELKAAVASAEAVREGMEAASAKLVATSEQITIELVGANRVLETATRELTNKQTDALGELDSRARRWLAGAQSRTVVIAAMAAGFGGVVGAVVATLLLR